MEYPPLTLLTDPEVTRGNGTDAEDEDDSPLKLLSNGGRHGSLVVMCESLHAMIAGRAAEGLLADYERRTATIPKSGGVWVAPAYGWAHPRIPVGRKDRGPAGERLLLPIRLQWDSQVVLVPERPKKGVGASWVTTSMGHSGTGSCTVTVRDVPEVAEVKGPASVPVEAVVPLLSREEAAMALSELADAGRAARWDLVLSLEAQVRSSVHSAHRALTREMCGEDGATRLIDETKIESVVDRILLGEGEHPGKLGQLIERLLDPETQNRVDPLRYIYTNLRRDAKEAVRQEISDPRIGAQVRAFAREHGLADDPEELVRRFREQHPNARLSLDRANAALTAGPDAMAEWTGVAAQD